MSRGKLKIFFGMVPGVGKTYAMLQEAQSEFAKGVQVVVGFVSCYPGTETCTLLEGLTVVPYKKIKYKNIFYEEMDTDTIFEMNPDLVIISDLAHINAPGSPRLKRYQDIQELLDAGIDVYTTLDVLHLQSYADIIFQATGATVTEILPDEFFDQADEIILIDLTYNQLLDRIIEGKIRTSSLTYNLSSKGNILFLRKLTHRIVADRLDKQQIYTQGVSQVKPRILVLIEPNVASMQAIRRAKAMACTLDTDWIALYIETNHALSENDAKQVANNINMVRQLCGELIISSDNDPVKACVEVARRENVSNIIVGKSKSKCFFDHTQKKFVNRLLNESDNINIYIIGSKPITTPNIKKKLLLPSLVNTAIRYVLTIVLAISIALICISLVDKAAGYETLSFVVLIILFVIAAMLRTHPAILATITIVLACGILLISPQPTFHFDSSSDLNAFLMFLAFPLFSGILITRFKEQEKRAMDREKQSNALFLLAKRLAESTDYKDVIETSIYNIRKYFSIDAFFIFRDKNHQLTNQKYVPKDVVLSESEQKTAQWAFKYNMPAGKFTETSSSSPYTFYPLQVPNLKMGVIVARLKQPFNGKTVIFWDAFLAQISQAIEHLYLGQLTRKKNMLDESDKLYKTLFNSISHELRIPVATIMGASDILISDEYPENLKSELYEEILKASKRLNRLIENLLNMSRLESGRIAAHLNWCDIHDLINGAIEDLQEELQYFKVDVVIPISMPLVKLDFGLMEQTLYNLVYNACLYSKEQTTIRIKTLYENNQLVLQVMDRGPGFEPNDLPYVFNKFWRYKNTKTGGLGLGLSIVKGFVEAHNGTVIVENRKNGGVCFTIKIPTEISNDNNE